jgi:hypothetical protein
MSNIPIVDRKTDREQARSVFLSVRDKGLWLFAALLVFAGMGVLRLTAA